MVLLNKNTQEENLSYLLKNIDSKGTLTDEFLAEFSGVNKADFNRRADQLIKNGVISIFEIIVTAERDFIGHVNEKITRKYLIKNTIIILSQYKNEHQVKAMVLCKLALEYFFKEIFKGGKNKTPLSKKSTLPAPVYALDLSGNMTICSMKKRAISELSTNERLEARIIHSNKIISGINKSIEKDTKQLFQHNHNSLFEPIPLESD